jgi:hypothetical protein
MFQHCGNIRCPAIQPIDKQIKDTPTRYTAYLQRVISLNATLQFPSRGLDFASGHKRNEALHNTIIPVVLAIRVHEPSKTISSKSGNTFFPSSHRDCVAMSFTIIANVTNGH